MPGAASPVFGATSISDMVKTQFSYVLPLGLANLIYTLETDLHNYFVSNAFGAAAFAIYSVGTTQLPLIGILRESIASVLLTRVSYLQKQGAARDILVLSLRVARRLAIVYWPLYALLLVIGKDLIVLMYTKRFLASWPIFLVNITLIPFMIIVQDPILRAYAQYRYYLLVLRIVLLGVLLAGLTWGIRELGMIGAVSVVIALSLIERFCNCYQGRSGIGIQTSGPPDVARPDTDSGRCDGSGITYTCSALAARWPACRCNCPQLRTAFCARLYRAGVSVSHSRCRRESDGARTMDTAARDFRQTGTCGTPKPAMIQPALRQPIRVVAIMEAYTVTGPAKNLIRFAQKARVPDSELPPVELSITTFHRPVARQTAAHPSNQFINAARAAGIEVDVIAENSSLTRV